MTHFPPEARTESDKDAIREAHRDADVLIRWSTEGDSRAVSSLRGKLLAYRDDPNESPRHRLDIRLPYPIDTTLSDPDLSQRAYEVMVALAEGKSVTIED